MNFISRVYSFRAISDMKFYRLISFFIIFLQIFSVVPGKTVDSKNIISSFFIYFAIVSNADLIYFKSGNLFFFIGVGTVTIKKICSFQTTFIWWN